MKLTGVMKLVKSWSFLASFLLLLFSFLILCHKSWSNKLSWLPPAAAACYTDVEFFNPDKGGMMGYTTHKMGKALNSVISLVARLLYVTKDDYNLARESSTLPMYRIPALCYDDPSRRDRGFKGGTAQPPVCETTTEKHVFMPGVTNLLTLRET